MRGSNIDPRIYNIIYLSTKLSLRRQKTSLLTELKTQLNIFKIKSQNLTNQII